MKLNGPTNLVSPRPNMPAPKRTICVCWNLHTNERNKVKNGAYVDEYVRHFIDNEPIPGIEMNNAIMNQIVPNLSVEMVNSLIPALVTDSNLVVNVFFPEKEGLKFHPRKKFLAAINKVKAETLTAYEDKVSDEPLILKSPKAERLQNRKMVRSVLLS